MGQYQRANAASSDPKDIFEKDGEFPFTTSILGQVMLMSGSLDTQLAEYVSLSFLPRGKDQEFLMNLLLHAQNLSLTILMFEVATKNGHLGKISKSKFKELKEKRNIFAHPRLGFANGGINYDDHYIIGKKGMSSRAGGKSMYENFEEFCKLYKECYEQMEECISLVMKDN